MTKTIIEEYRKLTENIAVVKSCLISNKREISKLINMNINIPKGLGAVDLTKPAVQTSFFQGDLIAAYIKLHDLETNQEELESELQSLFKQRDELEKTINDLGDIEKKCMMLRIKGYKNWMIAKDLNYSLKGIEKIFYRIKKKSQDS